MDETEDVKKNSIESNITFSKEKIINSEKYKFKQDLVNALLSDSQAYSLAQVDSLIENYENREVN